MGMGEVKMLTTPEVAERLNVSVRRVQALIEAGRLPSQQYGRDHLVKETDLKLVEDRRPGRPPKAKAEGSTVVEKPKRATKKGGKK
jgi:excisionase family DNA binding protein